MQMSMRCGGNFTTNASVVVQISKRQDLRPVSRMPTTPLSFRLAKAYYRDDVLLLLERLFNIFLTTKLLPKVRGVSLSSDRA